MRQRKTRVLCVDDEPQILEGLAVQLRRAYDVHTAGSGARGLELIAQEGPFAVVLSDMRMPGMDGAAFLARVRQRAPYSVRMLLTGYAELKSAIAAVNEGQIFRFLTKPCYPDQLRLALEAAAEQYRLVTAERVLLEQTLHGSIKALTDILAMTKPLAFGRATRVSKHVSDLAFVLDERDRWQVEIAAMVSQLGSVSLPDDTAEKYYCGQELTIEEQGMVFRMSKVRDDVLAHIPRLEPIREILDALDRLNRGEPLREDIPIGAKIMKIASDFDELESDGHTAGSALDTMRERKGVYEQVIFEAFAELRGPSAEEQATLELELRSVRMGMVFAEDVRTEAGVLLVTRGYQVTPGFIERVRNIQQDHVRNMPVRVRAPTTND